MPVKSVDLVTAGQAFHWFDPALAKREFRRILRPGGNVVLLWNSRQLDTTPFLRAYEELLQTYALDYREVSQKNDGEEVLVAFFAPAEPRVARYKNEQRFDLEGLQGRLLSSSYAPLAGHPRNAPMLARLREIFTEHQAGGEVIFLYDTEVFVGKVVIKKPGGASHRPVFGIKLQALRLLPAACILISGAISSNR